MKYLHLAFFVTAVLNLRNYLINFKSEKAVFTNKKCFVAIFLSCLRLISVVMYSSQL